MIYISHFIDCYHKHQYNTYNIFETIKTTVQNETGN